LAKGMRIMVTGRLEQRTWETDQGDRRSKVEIVAEEIGPSLRFATATVARNERTPSQPGPSAAADGTADVTADADKAAEAVGA
jgi:single-strand DNA-binding protein